MSTFKTIIAQDLDAFINPDEFGTEHNIDGRTMLAVIDSDQIKRKQNTSDTEGVYGGDIVLFVKKEDFGERPAIEQLLKLDGETTMISDVQEDEGLYSITLVANMS